MKLTRIEYHGDMYLLDKHGNVIATWTDKLGRLHKHYKVQGEVREAILDHAFTTIGFTFTPNKED